MKLSLKPLSLAGALVVSVGCSSDQGFVDDVADGSGGTVSTGGTVAASGGNAAGGATSAGGLSGTGGVALPPVDCSGITANGWELCSSTADSCGAVFTDGAGCAEVCASVGLGCAETWENAEASCGADTTRPALSCDAPSGHSSDYCLCARDGAAPGSGGAAGTGGSDGVGGVIATGGTSGGTGGSAGGSGGSTGGTGGSGGSTGGAGGSGGTGGSGGGGNGPCAVPNYISSQPTPIGWASQNGGTTGGGNATPILVTSLSQFKSEVAGTTPKVLYVQGTFAPDKITFGSNKTIIGCSSGAHIQGAISIGNGSSNIIVRNVAFSGYGVGNCALDPDYDSGTGCSSGNDAIGIKGNAHHVWFDHCSVKDGTDGNLDVTNNADFVTISWTKFSYTPRTDNQGDDSTGAAGHRFSNLVGGTDTAPSGFPGTIPLNVTWHNNWWAEGVVERQPRVRYGRNHLFNNYYSSSVTNYCVRAGIEAQILLQGNHFDGVDSPHQFNNSSNQSTAYIAVGQGALANLYSGTSGDQATGGGGDQWTNPPYAFTVAPSSGVKAAVMDGAGPH